MHRFQFYSKRFGSRAITAFLCVVLVASLCLTAAPTAYASVQPLGDPEGQYTVTADTSNGDAAVYLVVTGTGSATVTAVSAFAYATGDYANGSSMTVGGNGAVASSDWLDITYKITNLIGDITVTPIGDPSSAALGPAHEFSAAASTTKTYNAGDIAVINNIIDVNGLGWTKADPADGSYVPSDWAVGSNNHGVTWSDSTVDKRIITMNISGENLTGNLDISGLTSLTTCYCYSNQLTSLNVSNLALLKTLDCGSNQLNSLNISGLSSLSNFNCSSNQLTTIDLSGLNMLNFLTCSYNGLESLDVSNLTSLYSLDCSYNKLTSLNVSGLALLYLIRCNNNLLSTLDMSGLPSIMLLYCSYNRLQSLDMSGLSTMTTLYCDSNQLTSLKVSGLTSLTNLLCSTNKLTTLDLSGLTALSYLECGSNQLSTLDVTGLISLTYLGSGYNYLPNPDAIIGIETVPAFTEWDTPNFIFSIQYLLLTVDGSTDASGSGRYIAGTRADISAGTPPTGQRFSFWTSNNGGQFGDVNSATTTFVMPYYNETIVTAHFETVPTTYSAEISPTSKTFPEATAGYAAQAAQKFTVTNTGTGSLSGLSAFLVSGVQFEISATLSAAILVPNETATVSMRPKTGLLAGTYTDTLKIIGDNGINISVPLSMTVTSLNVAPTPQPAQVTAIRSAQKTFYVVKGKSLTIPYMVDLAPGENKAPVLTWSSDNLANVSIDQNGKVKGLAAGKSAKITITADNGVSKTFIVKVVKAAVKATGVSVSKPPKTLKVGQTAVLKVKVSPSKATGAVAKFSSSKKSVATVDKAGKVTAIAKGTAKITVKAGGKKTVVTITVK